MRLQRAVASMIFVLASTSASARANVSLKNGNFFIGYTDIIYSGGFEPKVERVYNAKSPFKGAFGWGWGMEFEVYLAINGDGTLTAHEYGGGAENVFVMSGHPTQQEIVAEAEQIVLLRKKPEGDVAPYRRRLLSDASFRADEWNDLVRLKLASAPDVPVGSTFLSDRFSHQKITRTGEGYLRSLDNGRTELFNRDGHLVRIADTNGNELRFAYDSHGWLAELEDNFKRRIAFKHTPKGLVSELDGTDGRRATYRYDASDDLIYSRDTDGNVYEYTYDARHRHNLESIRYADKTTMEMVYYPREKHENIRSVKDRDGTLTLYDYFVDHADENHYFIGVEVTTDGVHGGGSLISTSSYEYRGGHKSDGQEFTAQLVTVLDGDSTDTTYDAQCGMPLRIAHNGEVTAFAYDSRCHVTHKETPTEITDLTYDPAVFKVSWVGRESKADHTKTSSTFAYDGAGNLRGAENSEGKKLSLQYDEHGRISVMSDLVAKRTVRFQYNENSKPTEIAVEGVGAITVTYAANGEIKKVDSPAGRAAALAVTQEFQDLLDVIRPAGVSLSF